MLAQQQLVVTMADRGRLHQMIGSLRASLRTVRDPYDSFLRALEDQLARTWVVPATEVDDDIVTMNSKVCVRAMDTGRRHALTLVYDCDSEPFGDKVSVLAPLGASILGARVGQIVEWQAGRVPRRVRVERILFQPEAAGKFDL